MYGSIQEQEEREYQEGVEYTRWLQAKLAGFEGAPVPGEEGWTPELEAEIDSVRRQLDGF